MSNGKRDKLDMLILSELRKNCKQNLKQLAAKFGTHPNTLLQRIRKLEREGVIIGYLAEVDYGKLGYDLQALIMIKMNKGMLHDPEIIRELGKIPQVKVLYGVTGSHDCVALISAKNKDELVEILQKIQSNRLVIKTMTYLVLSTYKSPHEFNPL